MRPLKRRCRILPAGGLGVSPSIKKVPQDWWIRGLIKKSSNDDAPALIYLNEITA
jgi:hypothetical protein